MDSFYKVLTQEQHEAAEQNEYNFDHPDAFDFELLIGNASNYILNRVSKGQLNSEWIYEVIVPQPKFTRISALEVY